MGVITKLTYTYVKH